MYLSGEYDKNEGEEENGKKISKVFVVAFAVQNGNLAFGKHGN